MSFAVTQGESYHDMVTLCLLRGVTIPDEDEPPELVMGLDIFLSAFWELDRERIDIERMIRPSDVDTWLAKNNVTDPEFVQALHHHVTKLDIEYLRLMREKRKREASDGVGNSGNRR